MCDAVNANSYKESVAVMTENFELVKVQLKENILRLINDDKQREAQNLLNEYLSIENNDIETFSIQSVIDIKNGDLEHAQKVIEKGLTMNQQDFDLLYNLAYIFELKKEYVGAVQVYLQLSKGQYGQDKVRLACEAVERLQQHQNVCAVKEKRKLVIFVKTGLDNFIDDIIQGLVDEYDVQKIIVTDLRQIDKEMSDADVCWFEWCDELVSYGSKLPLAKEKKIICRLHRYEAFSDYIQNVAWENVDKVIFVAEHIRDVVLKKTKLPQHKCYVVYNGINLDKFSYVNRKKGFNLAWIGYLNLRKNPMLVLQHFNELVKEDNRYHLYIAGSFQDEALLYYTQDIVQRLNLQQNIHFDGFIPHDKMNDWLKDKDYIITGSIGEGHPVGVMEAMASGLKPVIHYFPGAESFYSGDFIYYDLAGFKRIILEDKYDSEQYRNFIQRNYSLNKQIGDIKEIITSLMPSSMNMMGKITKRADCSIPLVTIGVINYNQEQYIEECLQSILNQDYPNKEILIVDDCSTDRSMDIINKYISAYENIKLIKHDVNSGSGSKGVQNIQIHAKGKYFTFIDADDYYAHNDVLTSWVKVAEDNKKLDFVYGNFVIVNQTGGQLDVWKYKDFDRNQVIFDVFSRLGSGVMPLIGLYKKDFYIKNKLTWHYDKELKIGYDTINCLLNLKHGWQYKYLDKDCLCYRRHDKNVTNNSRERIRCAITMTEYIANNYSEKIYLPQIRWQEVKGKSFRNAVKAFYLGSYFMQAYKQFAGIDSTVNLQLDDDGIALLEILRPFEDKIDEYFAKSLKEHNIFSEDITKFRAEFDEIKAKLVKPRPNTQIDNLSLPRVSIIIPTYNRREFLEQALESVLEQDYEKLEIIVSDNASTDGTQEMMQDFLLDERVKYHKHDHNIGAAANHQYALYELATGKFALVLSDDDYLIDNSYISKAVELISNNPGVVLVHANCKIYNVKTNVFTITDHKAPLVVKGNDYFVNYEKPGYDHIVAWLTSLFDREKAMQAGCLKEKTLAGDLLLYLKLMLQGDIGVLQDCVAVYRLHEGGGTNSLDLEHDIETIKELEKIQKIAMKKGLPTKIMNDWINFRIFKYVRWCCISYFTNNKTEFGMNLLSIIRDRYPVSYKAITESLQINTSTRLAK